MSQEKKFYVYVHRYASGPKEGQVFYVGKGSGDRLNAKPSRSKYWHSINSKYGFKSGIVTRFERECCAFSFEAALIRYLGRDNLCNLSDGGDGGASGYVWDRSKVEEKAIKCFKKVINSDGIIFQSLKDAAEFCRRNGYEKASESHISSCCNGKRSVAYGLSWSFNINSVPDLLDYRSKVNEDRLLPVMASNGMMFKSVSEAARWVRAELGVKCGTSDISRCCSGKRKICAGLEWAYHNGT